jgi:transcriptional regulator with PAS, ATPase and Fis domain
MMNTDFRAIRTTDSLRAVVSGFQDKKIDILPVVDEEGRLEGVFPKTRLYRALLSGAELSSPCEPFVVDDPLYVYEDREYNESSFVSRVTNSLVSNVIVLDKQDKVVGTIGTVEYLRESIKVISESSAELESMFMVNREKLNYYRNRLEETGSRVSDQGSAFDQIITTNPQFTKIKKDALRIAHSSSTVLLTGESGVGKSMFARGIHEASPRSKAPFVAVNCVSIPENLFESELFGYAPGAFTGALKSGKPGFFERAEKGTVFLDEIGDIPLSVQTKLLEVLQEKEYMRVGGTTKIKADVRIIAATNRNLTKAVEEKLFREDLYYRLNVIEFYLPPLRDRRQDIVPLAVSFIGKYNRLLGSRVTGIADGARKILREYDWPGNIRELENAIEHAANFVWEGSISKEDLPDQILGLRSSGRNIDRNLVTSGYEAANKTGVGGRALSYKAAREEFEREAIIEAIKAAGGNKSAAARQMKLSRSAFYERLAKYGIK